MSGSTSMVFTRTCDATRLLALMLRNLGLRAIPISGQMTQVYRTLWHILTVTLFRFAGSISSPPSPPNTHQNNNSNHFLLGQDKRLGALNKFKAGECNILICTDVASRGLDIPSVDMVINYDIPTNSKVDLAILPACKYLLVFPVHWGLLIISI